MTSQGPLAIEVGLKKLPQILIRFVFEISLSLMFYALLGGIFVLLVGASRNHWYCTTYSQEECDSVQVFALVLFSLRFLSFLEGVLINDGLLYVNYVI